MASHFFNQANKIYADLTSYVIQVPNGSVNGFINKELVKGFDSTLVNTLVTRFIAIVKSRFINVNTYADFQVLLVGKTESEIRGFFQTFINTLFADTVFRNAIVALQIAETDAEIVANNVLIAAARTTKINIKVQFPNNQDAQKTLGVIDLGISVLIKINQTLEISKNNFGIV